MVQSDETPQPKNAAQNTVPNTATPIAPRRRAWTAGPNAPTGARRPLLVAVLLLLGLFAAASANAYIVVLKDGTQILTTKKYELDGERVLLTLRNGTVTFYDASDVDFETTEELNADGGAGGATFIEEKVIKTEEPIPDDPDVSISDVAGGQTLGVRLPEPKKRKPKVEGEAALPRTAAGYVDLLRIEREPYGDAEVASEVQSYLEGQGNRLTIFEGVDEAQPLLEIRANTESEVFKGIRDSASALVQLSQRFADQVQGFDLLFLTEKDVRGGQFSMTAEQAQLIVSGRLEPQLYFLRYVEF